MKEALRDESWTATLQEELNKFVSNDVWNLVPRPKDKHVIVQNGFSRINKMKMG